MLERVEPPSAVQPGTLADHVAGHPGPGGGALHQRAEGGQPRAIGGPQVRLDRFDGFDDVSVGVEDPIAAARHSRLPP
jgi:hypothetical protein